MSAEDLQRAIDLPAALGERPPRGRVMWRAAGAVRACRKGSPADLRAAALIGVLYGAGLRRAGIVALNLSDYDPETGALTVRGKGSKERLAYIDDGAAEAMLFCPITQTGRGNDPLDY